MATQDDTPTKIAELPLTSFELPKWLVDLAGIAIGELLRLGDGSLVLAKRASQLTIVTKSVSRRGYPAPASFAASLYRPCARLCPANRLQAAAGCLPLPNERGLGEYGGYPWL
ncbi:MAG TPA: hypothetical protein VIH98_00310 [Xanthobacteraceae bacterium]